MRKVRTIRAIGSGQLKRSVNDVSKFDYKAESGAFLASIIGLETRLVAIASRKGGKVAEQDWREWKERKLVRDGGYFDGRYLPMEMRLIKRHAIKTEK